MVGQYHPSCAFMKPKTPDGREPGSRSSLILSVIFVVVVMGAIDICGGFFFSQTIMSEQSALSLSYGR